MIKIEEKVLFHLIQIALGKGDVSSLPNVVNWGEVYDLAVAQGIIALTWSDVISAQSTSLGIDEELKYKWIGQQFVVEQTNLKKWESAHNLSALWRSNGIKPVVLKGLSYARLYPNPLHRACSDLDTFLFDEWEKGNQLVEETGVKVSRGYYKDSSFSFGELFVENHRFCSPIRGGEKRKQYEKYLRSLLTGVSLKKIEGTDFYTPPALFNILFFLSHAQNHFLNEGGITLRHVCDWAMIMRAYSPETLSKHDQVDGEELWGEVIKKCAEYKLIKFAYSISQVAKVVCGVAIPFDCPVNEKADDALLSEILHPTCQHVEFSNGWHTRWQLVISTLQSGWKFRLYSEQSMFKSLIQSVWAFLFEREPRLE